MRSMDLNSDLGEGCDSDERMLSMVSSANIACGGHAGDSETMRRIISLAMERHITIGPHPSYPDREGFGGRRMNCTPIQIRDFIARQTEELMVHAHSLGAHVSYIKPHGALGNDAATNENVANAVIDGLEAVDRRLSILAISGTQLERAARLRGIKAYSEVYADRGYSEEGLLVPRSQPRALIEDIDEAVTRLREYIKTGKMKTITERSISLAGVSICVHGDNSHAVDMASRIRDMLLGERVRIEPFMA